MPARVSRSPALPRFRKARMERAIEAFEGRAAALAEIAGSVTSLVAGARTRQVALRRDRLARKKVDAEARRAAQAALRQKVAASLSAREGERGALRVQAKANRRADRASLREQSLRILQTDFR